MRKDGGGPVSGVHLWLLLWKASRAAGAAAEADIARRGLGVSEFGALEALYHKGPLPVNGIGRKVLLTSGSVTAAVDRLERRGLVARAPHHTDRRVRLVRLTAKGKKVISAAFARHARTMERAMAHMEPGERATLAALLKKLGSGIAAPPGGASGKAPRRGRERSTS